MALPFARSSVSWSVLTRVAVNPLAVAVLALFWMPCAHAQLEHRVLANHLPRWANQHTDAGAIPPEEPLNAMTLVLEPPAEHRQALETLLAAQQDPHSPLFHHWLTPTEFGQRFGLADEEIARLTEWLASQGLHVDWVSTGKTAVGFHGTAGDVGRAFGAEMRNYQVNGKRRIAPATAPKIPAALTSIKAVHGLYTIEDRPMHYAETAVADHPNFTGSSGNHYIAPADFATIYNLPSVAAAGGVTIGIVGRSRVDPDDISNFSSVLNTTLATPIEIVPTAYGGVDPGPAYTSPPPSGTNIEDQLEATLDVTRAGSVAYGSSVELVVATSASGGIEVDAQYLVNSTPAVQVMSISFGACESDAGSSGVNYWDTLFKQAASEGISVFVSSGDAGASGCDANFSTPPASPKPNSPNYICSSSYATCVGGTEFADASNPSKYWYGNALSYIPEGAWNEPSYTQNGVTHYQAASSGGGVSSIIPTPSWQTGAGVPAARTGRYTPDIAFSASCHDGYFACFAAGGAGCVVQSNGEWYFEYFCGTSAAAPDMAGIAGLLDQKMAWPQGNLNPGLYQLAANPATAAVFHDATPATSGVAGCNISTPSICNNSIPSPTSLTGGQAGYPVTVGYDEVTGLGSLDIYRLLANWPAPQLGGPATISPSSLTFQGDSLGWQTITLSNPSSSKLPLYVSTIAIIGADAYLFQQQGACGSPVPPGNSCTISVNAAACNCTATLTITDNASNSPQTVLLNGFTLENTYVASTDFPLNAALGDTVTAHFMLYTPSGSNPTGTLTVAMGGTTLATGAVNSGTATLTVPITMASGFGIGSNTVTVSYSGDANYYPFSTQRTLVVYPPGAPFITKVDSDGVQAGIYSGSGTYPLTIEGANFAPGALALLNGTPMQTGRTAGTALQMFIPFSYLASPSTYWISVVNPAPNAGVSASVRFVVWSLQIAPIISQVSYEPAGENEQVAVTIANAASADNLIWNGQYFSATEFDYTGESGWTGLAAYVPLSTAQTRPANVQLQGVQGSNSPVFVLH